MIYVNREAVAMITCWGKERIFRGRKVVDDIIKQKVYEYITKKLMPSLDELIMFDCGEHGTITGTFVECPDDQFEVMFDTAWILNHEDGEIYSLLTFTRYNRESQEPAIAGHLKGRVHAWLPVVTPSAVAGLMSMTERELNQAVRMSVKRV